MYKFHPQVSVLAMIYLGLLSACVSTPEVADQEIQQAAIGRWNHCIDKQAANLHEPIIATIHRIEQLCDGHKRDVLAVFPAHLEKRLDLLLTERAQRRAAQQVADAGINAVLHKPVAVRPAVVKPVTVTLR